MADPVDVYCDQFQISIGAWGATLNFQLSSAQPPAPGSQPQVTHVATVRTGLAHLKVIAMILKRHVSTFESESGVVIDVPSRVLASLGIPREDWDVFWRSQS